MYLSKQQRFEKTDSISNCFNELVKELHQKKSSIRRNFKGNEISINMPESPQNIKSRKNYQGVSLEKIIHSQIFDKKYSKIMGSLSLSPQRQSLESPQQKNINLMNFKLNKDSFLEKDQSLKRLDNLKLNIMNSKKVVISEEKNNHQKPLNLSNSNFKQSNTSDFFKSTLNSANRTFYTSKNSFYNSATNFNILNNFSNNIYNNEAIKLENLSFNSFKSLGSFSNHTNKKNNFNNNTCDKNPLKTNFHIDSQSGEKSSRVNFDYFNTIGENPFGINVHDTQKMINSAKNKVIMKNSNLSISPKNFYSPIKDRISDFSRKKLIEIDNLYTGSKKIIEQLSNKSSSIKKSCDIFDLKNEINKIEIGSRLVLSPKDRIKFNDNKTSFTLKNSGDASNRIPSAYSSNNHYRLKKLDNLLKNFSGTKSFLDKSTKHKKFAM